jgi:hypothetical protein
MDTLKNILIEYANIRPNKGLFFEDSFDANNLSFRQLSFVLINLGTILKEDSDNNVYIISAKHRLNIATICIELKDNKINLVAFANEGLIKQHTAQKVSLKIKNAILGN